MSPETPNKPAPDFSNYAWFQGAFRNDAACVATDDAQNLYLGVKGKDRKSGQRGYLSIRLTPKAAQALAERLLAAVAEQPAPKVEQAADLAAQKRRLTDAAGDAYDAWAEAHELSLPGGDGSDATKAEAAYRAAEAQLAAFTAAHPQVA